MEKAIYNLLILIEDEIINPVFAALRTTRVFDTLTIIIKNIINAFFKLFHDNELEIINDADMIYSILAEILGIIFICIVLKIVIKLFDIAFKTINDNLKRRIK